jgi:uncharacterized SAM-dependent methyltransferase
MLYFRHSELADKYHVSLKTVHNWIDAAKQGKLELKLTKKGSRTYIANNPGNVLVLEKLSEEGRKYRNVRFHKTITPTSEFYELYNRRQILDIITNLEVRHEIPRQYNYFNGGAINWDRFAARMWEAEEANLTKKSFELVQASFANLDELLAGVERVNIVDLGPGNAIPSRGILEHLHRKGVLHRYIAVDISSEMLKIAAKNIDSWFEGKVLAETYVRDITFERFDDLLVDDMLAKDASETINLALFLGGTLPNFHSPNDALKAIVNSLSRDDLLIFTCKPDFKADRYYFDFSPTPGTNSLSPSHRMILDLMGIDESLYEVDMGFDEVKKMRFIQIRFTSAVTLKFKFDHGERDVSFQRGDKVLLLRIWHMTPVEIVTSFREAGFTMVQANVTKDQRYFFMIAGIDATT